MAPMRKIDVVEILKSRIIKFIVGEDKVEYNVHEAAISGLSGPLRALVTNGMKESMEGVLVWDEVDPEVFAQMVEYAYGRELLLRDHNERRGTIDDDDLWGTIYDYCDGHQYDYYEVSLSLEYRIVKNDILEWKDGVSAPALSHCPDRFKDLPKWVDPDDVGNYLLHFHSEDYFMAHARLYCLADQYAIVEMAMLCVEKLQRILYEHPTTESFHESICKLLLFVWPRTLPKDELRSLLIDFVLTNLTNALVLNIDKFGPVLDEIPEIAVTILRNAPAHYWRALDSTEDSTD
ncbi:hypothetical protein HER10_EVM0011785 [Colletotrichum scovillei]|uniref:Peptidase family M3 n=1 Tax=Colletotrichum scovillei TaxID=1209932 RepID=A0A9P7U732_9PEZI|nr:uncharacterized protein HER10_EVM0011785 [Colletotrichum scovillei]KAF4778877.1 hypothetical protein HER10_EVM0011785 [Colletotrichum scovillei]KAG7039971.1 peptidase family M3 [Colletotrichum scovillei]KAG7042145.1 peptidase family M3 [Colletotrichum scovillei]KAG7062179.1 peptidase family M3 [Colletotrichum scovillei]